MPVALSRLMRPTPVPLSGGSLHVSFTVGESLPADYFAPPQAAIEVTAFVVPYPGATVEGSRQCGFVLQGARWVLARVTLPRIWGQSPRST